LEKFYYEIAISKSPLRAAYTYSSSSMMLPGTRVLVNFSNRAATGYVVDEKILSKENSSLKIKEIEDYIDYKPLIDERHIALAKRVSEYYLTPIGKVFDLFFSSSPDIKINQRIIKKAFDEYIEGFEGKEGSVSMSVFFERLGKIKGKKSLKKLIEEGKVEIATGLSILKPKERQIKIVRLKADLEEILNKKISRQAEEIVQYLLFYGESTEKNIIKNLCLKSSSPLNTLEKAGYLEVDMMDFKPDEYSEKRSRISLHAIQIEIAEKIKKSFKKTPSSKGNIHLIHGITGSGKTEIYFDLIDSVLKEGKKAMFLLPEISLTPQMIARIRNRFPEKEIETFHSSLNVPKRKKIWRDAVCGKIDILLGTRSCLWIPVPDLGLYILDEEHDESFMQEDSLPVYDARQVCEWFSELFEIPVVLGSATPRMETFYEAAEKKIKLHSILERPMGITLPDVKAIDMIHEERFNYLFAKETIQRLDETVSAGKQAFILVSKKGFASYTMCLDCGFVIKCPNCEVSMTYHLYSNFLKCHYCGFENPIPQKCPQCGSKKLSKGGYGTEKVEEQLNGFFPELKVLRIDRDIITNIEDLNTAYDEIKKGKVRIVVGTKMISKGLDFPDVDLVVILNADQYLFFPDFRSNEKTFQLLSQMSGRAGRANSGAKVIIQTYSITSKPIIYAVNHDYRAFFEDESKNRELAFYPPYSHIILFLFKYYDKNTVETASFEFCSVLKAEIEKDSVLLGPTPCLITKIAGQYRYQAILKTGNTAPEIEKVSRIINRRKEFDKFINIVVDPIKMMI